MKTVLVCFCLWISVACRGAHIGPARFYVSPAGNDVWSGRLAAPAAGGNDGPFRTVERARDAVREVRGAAPTEPVIVEIRGGTYYLRQPLAFGPEDSGTAEAPVTYRAYAGETPIFCGGRVLTGWQVGRTAGQQPLWTVDVPEVREGKWSFCQLFVQRQGTPELERRFRPTKGMFTIAGLTCGPVRKGVAPHRAAQDEFKFFPDDLQPWENLADVEVLALHCWSSSRLLIRALDREKQIVAFTGYPTFRVGSWWADQRNPYFVENVKEALAAPGEWYLDRPTGVLSYLPKPGETPDSIVVIAPVHEQLLRLAGDPGGTRTVAHLRFEQLTFAVSQWRVPPAGYGGSQAMPDLGAAVELSYAQDCVFERCTVAHTGAYAVALGLGCQRNRLAGLTLYDMGGGGIKIGASDMKHDAQPPTLPVGNVVENNLIAHGGILHFSANAIWAGIVKDTVIRHNEIRHFPYSGIAVGWKWSLEPTSCGGNRIEDNHIHQVVELLGDGASIYTLGHQPGTVIRGNVLHDNPQSRFAPAPWQLGIYLDEGSAHILTENNLVYRVGTHAFNLNGGAENLVRNNVFGPTLNADQPFIRCHVREPQDTGNRFEQNILYWDGDVLVDKSWPVANVRCDNNLYWNFAGKPVTFQGRTFAQWQGTGQDPHSVVADPQLLNPEADDFRVGPTSPACALGFRPFDPFRAGLEPAYRDLDRAVPSVARPPVYAMPAAPVRETPFGFDLDLEDVPVGRVPGELTVNGATDNAHIQVTDETAKSGKKCLKVTDRHGLSRYFYPFLTYEKRRENGPLHLSFCWKSGGEKPIQLTVNVRDYDTARKAGVEFVTGIAFTLSDKDTLLVGDKEIVRLPHSEWAKVDIRFAVGEGRPDGYQIELTDAQERRQTFALPIVDPAFRTFTWLGFIADGEQDGGCYLDDLRLLP